MAAFSNSAASSSAPCADVRITKKMLQALAPLPDTAVRLLSLLDDSDVPLREIAGLAARDVGLSATMLRMANSSMFGLRGRVGSISDALRVIGTAQARLLVLASGVAQLAQKELPQYGLAAGAFMRHSELVANLTMYVAAEIRYPNIGNAYSAGLLHDIGKIVINGLAQQAQGGAASLEAEMRRRGCSLLDAEVAVCGGTHAQIGSQLAELWALPAELSSAIACHHVAATTNEDVLARCVAIANGVAGALDPAYPAFNRAAEDVASDLIDVQRVRAAAGPLLAEAARSA
jgi:putative nucleotidyltransferase with HDIG domain